MMQEVLISIIVFLVIAVLTFFGNKFFIKRPKIKLTIQDDFAGSSTSEVPNHLRIKWNKYFVLKNITKYSAFNITFYNLDSNIIFHKNNTINIEGFNEIQIGFSFFEDIEKEKVISSSNRFIDLLPNYFNELLFRIEYVNEHNKKFYTYFLRRKNLEQNKFYFHKVYK